MAIADLTEGFCFNTDCVSCHTGTRRTIDLLNVTAIPGINPAALPGGTGGVRNFGRGQRRKRRHASQRNPPQSQ
jgi:hypothetical protein